MDHPLKAIFTPPDQKSNANPNLCQMRWATSWSYFVVLEGPSDQSLTGHQQEGFPHLSHDAAQFFFCSGGFSCHCCLFGIRFWVSVSWRQSRLEERLNGGMKDSRCPRGPTFLGSQTFMDLTSRAAYRSQEDPSGFWYSGSLDGRTMVMTQTGINGWKSKIKEPVLLIL